MSEAAESIMIGHPEAARLCGVGLSTWYNLVSAGKTPLPTKLGRRVLWLREELVHWCKNGCPGRDQWEALKKKYSQG
jgi:predicted DNA-binding transcriptional regulator AlpA